MLRGRNVTREIVDGTFHLTVTVPDGATAEVVLPDGTVHAQAPGEGEYTCVAG